MMSFQLSWWPSTLAEWDDKNLTVTWAGNCHINQNLDIHTGFSIRQGRHICIAQRCVFTRYGLMLKYQNQKKIDINSGIAENLEFLCSNRTVSLKGHCRVVARSMNWRVFKRIHFDDASWHRMTWQKTKWLKVTYGWDMCLSQPDHSGYMSAGRHTH